MSSPSEVVVHQLGHPSEAVYSNRPKTPMAPIADMRRRRTGDWRVGRQDAVFAQPNGGIIYRFHARDLHLVLGPAPDGKPAKFEVLIDGHAPGADHGADVDSNGDGVIARQ
jgi:Thioredoxin like C-terminal domain